MARFTEQEKVTLSTLGEVSSHANSMPDYVTATLDVAMAALSRRASAFAAAQRNDAVGIEARARAELFMIEIPYAAMACWRNKGALGAASIAHVANPCTRSCTTLVIACEKHGRSGSLNRLPGKPCHAATCLFRALAPRRPRGMWPAPVVLGPVGI